MKPRIDVIGGIRFAIRPFLRPDNEYTRRPRTDYLVVHCSASSEIEDIGAEEIREFHVEDRGFMDIGYHFVIRRDGTVENGRPVWATGAGVAGYNSESVHVCLVGGVRESDGKPEDNFTDEQYAALAFLLASLKKYVAPKAEVCGHRDFPKVLKACPSFDVRAWWGLQPTDEAGRAFMFEQQLKGSTFLN